MDEHHKIMTENLTERFVHHGNVSLTTQTVTKLPLHHAKGGLDVGPLVVVLQKLGFLELEVMIHTFPISAAAATVLRFEGNKGRGTQIHDGIGVFPRSVSLVSRNFPKLKILCGSLCQSRKHSGIACIPPENFYRRNNVGFDAALGWIPIRLVDLSHNKNTNSAGQPFLRRAVAPLLIEKRPKLDMVTLGSVVRTNSLVNTSNGMVAPFTRGSVVDTEEKNAAIF
jgi:hypothetical protein